MRAKRATVVRQPEYRSTMRMGCAGYEAGDYEGALDMFDEVMKRTRYPSADYLQAACWWNMAELAKLMRGPLK